MEEISRRILSLSGSLRRRLANAQVLLSGSILQSLWKAGMSYVQLIYLAILTTPAQELREASRV